MENFRIHPSALAFKEDIAGRYVIDCLREDR